jgi:hypothetical protein
MTRRQHRFPSRDGLALIDQILEKHRQEGMDVPYTMADFRHDYVKEHFPELTPEEQCEALLALSPEKREEVLQGLPLEERLAGLPPERRLAGLSAAQLEQVRQYLYRLTARRAVAPRKSRRKK